MLRSAVDHYARQQRLTAAALVAAQRRPWRDAAGIALIVAAFQQRAAEDAVASVPDMLAEQDLEDAPTGLVDPRAFAGTASDGRGLVSLFGQAASPEALELMVVTQVQDMARTAASVSVMTRPRMGWVRMLNPPSCPRCVVLAGKFFKANTGFQRHPRCDCRHIPTREAIADDLTVDPDAYFRSLSPQEQDRFMGKANAQAIRDGADVSQIVNAYRRTDGMQVAGVPTLVQDRGRKFTTEGSTKRSLAYAQQRALRRNGPVQLRLMPESIYEIATDRDHAMRLLRLYGWVLTR